MEKHFEQIIMHQTKLMLKSKGLTINDLTHYELLKHKYAIAIKLLCELSLK